ncbi:MAG: glycosyltransferase family 4 protein [Rhodocyclaceae bacterium]|nr:glycosyltransferase family 4 protein [Rhodocyclaceae bacterium]
MSTATGELLSPLLALLVAAATLAWLLGPGRARLPMDRPNERSLHQVPVPRSGGVAVVAGVLAACLPGWPTHGVLAGCVVVLAALSFADDWRSLPIALRFGLHAGAAGAFVWLALPPLPLAWQAATAFLIAWSINLYNFMDGSDGLAGGMAVCGFGTLAAAFALGGDPQLASLSLAIAVASAVFLKANFHPARIFLGDVGSVPLGFLAGALGAAGVAGGRFPAWFPFVVFAPFFVDATATLLRRMLRGERFWQAHREHYYQRLVRIGWGHRRTALAEYGLMAAGAAVALAALRLPVAGQALLLGAWGAALLAAMAAVDRRWQAGRATEAPPP